MAGKKVKSSLFQRALQRLSLRSHTKKYNLVIEKKDDTKEVTEEKYDVKEKVTSASSCPPTPYPDWRQHNSVPSEPEVDTDTASLCLPAGDAGDAGDAGCVGRARSLSVLDRQEYTQAGRGYPLEVPSNQLNQYQRRVQGSMEKLNVPSWFKSPSPSPATPSTPRWRQSSSSSTDWRRHLSNSVTASPSTPSTLERSSTPLSSQRYRSRLRALPSSSRSPSISSINSSSSAISPATISPRPKVYLGWRSQERLDTDPAFLASPASRLASSLLLPPKRAASNTPGNNASAVDDVENVKNDIMDITEAILNYCNTSSHEKSSLAKDGDEEEKDAKDDDSGIDRSDDYRQDIISDP